MKKGGRVLTEKDVWKWILDQFSDQELANLGKVLELKISGFREINPKLKNFKILRPKLIQEVLLPKNLVKLRDFFNSITTEKSDEFDYNGKNPQELLAALDEEVSSFLLITALLSSENEENKKNGIEIYKKLKAEGTLEQLENHGDPSDEEEVEESAAELKNEMLLLQQKLQTFERKLKKSEQKNEQLKSQLTSVQSSGEIEKKNWKEEKKKLLQQIQTLSNENGKLRNQTDAVLIETERMKKQLEQKEIDMKQKDLEISRLNALILRMKTKKQEDFRSTGNEVQGTTTAQVSTVQNPQVNVVVIGDPKNSRVQQYQKFNLTILDAPKIEEEKSKKLLESAENIWLLTYRIPMGVQKRVKIMLEGKELLEFATFIDLEKHMKKG